MSREPDAEAGTEVVAIDHRIRALRRSHQHWIRRSRSASITSRSGVSREPDALGGLDPSVPFIRQYDVDLEHLVVVLLFKLDLDVVRVDRDVL